MNCGPASSSCASRGIENAAIPVAGSKSVAPTDSSRSEVGPKKSCSECGSTPDFASVILATTVGFPVESLRVISLTVGGLTSLIHERSVYGPARERPLNRSRPESTET